MTAFKILQIDKFRLGLNEFRICTTYFKIPKETRVLIVFEKGISKLDLLLNPEVFEKRFITKSAALEFHNIFLKDVSEGKYYFDENDYNIYYEGKN